MPKLQLKKNKKIIYLAVLSTLIISILILSLFIINSDNIETKAEQSDSIEINKYPQGIRLTVNSNLTDSIVISWFTESRANNPKVLYSLEFNLSEAKEKKAELIKINIVYIYKVELVNLLPNTTYYYQIYSDNNNYRKIMSFKTLLNNPEKFRFLVYSDTHRQRTVRSILSKKIINNFKTKFDFFIHAGDIVDYGDEQSIWNNYFLDTEYLNAYKQGFYVEGNHEEGLQTKMYDNLPMLSNGTNRYYSFSYGGVGFIFLNTNKYTIDDEAQTEWLNQTLIKLSKENIFNFAFMHHPLLHSDESYSYHKKNWRPLFEKYNISILFSGHNHHYERSFPIINSSKLEYDNSEYFNYLNLTNPIYIVTGGGGAPLDSLYNEEFIATKIKSYNFLIVEIDKKLDKNVISLEVWVMLENTENIFLYETVSITNWN